MVISLQGSEFIHTKAAKAVQLSEDSYFVEVAL